MLCVLFAHKSAPNPEALEVPLVKKLEPDKLSKVFWLYTIFSFVTTLGFTSFVLIGYHFKVKHVITDAQIPLFYAIAMGVDAIAALIIGKTYDVFKNRRQNDKAGLSTLIIIPLLSVFIPFFAFSQSYIFALISAIIWGIVMGAHETVMKSAIADLTTLKKRGTGYGIFNTAYGLAIFIGSALFGLLYERSIPAIIIFSIIIQCAGVLVFFVMRKEAYREVGINKIELSK